MTQTAATGTERVRYQDRTDTRAISIITLGQALSVFFMFSYAICVIGYLLFPGMPVKHESLALFLPGFTLLSWHTFFLGLIESFIWGWYIAIVFGAIYNFFLRRAARGV
jgi:2TM family of unknown function (DUF5676)